MPLEASLVAMLPLSLLSRQLGSGIVALVIGIPCPGIGMVVARCPARLKDAVDLDAVRLDLTSVVQQTLEPAHLSVWTSEPGVSSGS